MSKKKNNKWKDILTPEQYKVCREKGTEPAFSGALLHEHRDGYYCCICCNQPLFYARNKFDSGTGWPSFWQSIPYKVSEKEDLSHGTQRTEITCSNCDSHLGHLFNDGPQPTSLRYCINSLALSFTATANIDKATSAAGCFWGVEATFSKVKGVLSTRVGYTGGTVPNPTYEQVCTGTTGHAEAIEVEFDPKLISYADLLEIFWQCHDPTTLDQQGPDIGTQYRSAIYYHSEQQKLIAVQSKESYQENLSLPIITEITQATDFYQAEEYHQQYMEKQR